MMSQYQQQNQTIIGVSIGGGAVDLAACNALNANFGYPMSVRTNLADSASPDMKLVDMAISHWGIPHLHNFTIAQSISPAEGSTSSRACALRRAR